MNIELKSKWKDGPRIWEVFDITNQAEVDYIHMKLIRGVHVLMDHKVVEKEWFDNKKQL